MNRSIRWLLISGMAAVLALEPHNVMAQANGNGGQRGGRNNAGQGRTRRDPAQAQAQYMDSIRQRLEITDDGEWKAIQPLVEKVSQDRRDLRTANVQGARGRRGNRQAEAQTNAPSATRADTNPEADALRKAVEGKAPATDISAKLVKFREAQKQKEAKLAKAQEDLRKVLSLRQEAIAVSLGLLP